jgi:putative Mn2+ efflux pump MntP
MNLWTLLLIAVGLSMDAFAVSVASGIAIKRLRVSHALRIAAAFGLFQAIMPVVGWLSGVTLRPLIAGLDHWVAFALLSVVGAKMIYEATRIEAAENPANPLNVFVLLMLSVATSLDALAVGFSFAILSVSIAVPALVIGAVTFALCLAGVFVGRMSGHFFEKRIEVAGGLVLIGIGFKILFDHLRG